MANTILWETKRLTPRKRGNRKETKVLVICDCGSERWLTPRDAQRCDRCHACNAKAALAACSPQQRIEGVQRYQLSRLNNEEMLVRDWLQGLNVPYEQQVIFDSKKGFFVIDFVVKEVLAVEVNGFWHGLKMAARDEKLCRYWQGDVHFVDGMNLTNGNHQLEFNRLAKFVGGYYSGEN